LAYKCRLSIVPLENRTVPRSAVRFDSELKNYYGRKLAEGKHKTLVLNAVKNKLAARVMAAVKRGTPYVPIMKYAA